jgi:DNA helicase-2/ATP-dependent DNA helicase PcrA
MESALLQGLNSSQRAAVLTVDGPLLLLAGPGSGKTRVVTHRIAHMIEQGIDPKSILALTFTNKAAEEMRGRLERLVGDAPLWMGTFHGFCVRLLRRYANLVGLPYNFNIYDTDDATAALRVAVEQADFSLTHTSLGALATRISYFKNRLVTPETLLAEGLSSDEHQIAQVYPFYQRQLLKNGAVDFDDLLMHTATLLRTSPTIRSELDERYRYIMVDEYQDTNLAQYVIVRQLSIDWPNLAVTGDPDQSIYGWRGANLKNVAYLERDYPDTKIIRLEDNYRSTPEILSVADCLIQNNEFRKPKKLVPSRSTGSPVRICVYATGRREAEDIVSQIVTAVNAGERSLGDFAILYRTNAQSRLVEQALAQQRIAYQLIGGFRFYLRKEIKDLVSYLLVLHNPNDDVALERAINTPPRGIGKQTLAKLKEIAGKRRVSLLDACRIALEAQVLGKKIAGGVRKFLDIQDRLSQLVHGSLLELINATLELTDYRTYLSSGNQRQEDRASEVMANLDELVAEAAEIDRQVLDRPPLEAFLEFAALQSDTDRLKGSDTVTLMTLHAAKGLEFPVVFIIALEENILPHQRSKDDPLAIEEERRLLFVGITRAKDQLQLSYARRRSFRDVESMGIPSSFLMELPRGEMTWSDQSEPDPYAVDQDWSGFDDYSQVAARWQDDEFNQETDLAAHHDHATVDASDEGDAGMSVEDEYCQLPPDELSGRVLSKFKGRLRSAAQIADSRPGGVVSDAAFSVGRIVSHPAYGSGRIIAASGSGTKRSVTVDFFSDGQHRDFRVSHAQLSIDD